MKVSQLMLFGIFFIGISSLEAQEKTSLTLDEAIHLAWTKSNEVSLANTKVATKKYELRSIKNNQYPDLKVSGQYQRLAKASVNLKINKSDDSEPTPVVNQLMLGQVNATVPVFAGFKIQNSIKIYDNLYQAETATASQTKEEIAMKVINSYANLYKAQKTIELLKENQKSARQRALDFNEMEKNGIIPRNDLLKSQLQVSKIQLSIDQAATNLNIVNFYLVTLLKLPVETKLEVRESDFANFQMDNIPTNEEPALQNRKDLEAIRFQEKASQANIKMAKSAYYPAIALIGGYTAFDLKNVITVQNAMNIGVGVSYDLSAILKNGAMVKLAESKSLEVQNSEAILTDYIKIQVQKAIEDYDLALKQNVVYGQALEQSTENYRIIKDKYDNGLSDTNDLLEADVEQLGSKINKALAKANIIQKYYELLSVTGQLSQSFNLSKI
ncbi:TolC family protein [Flavobacterium gawalongense]|uniref:TolC family protein n=1 Tax=Flavobacterium gawalongense TaxID=2594432 RepID=A0A553BVA4_9FLAO|nr:TolC family protein [Flavobacterium gawalongense]TRX10938.1 TolC family protein [Flavobacterium gawalongense]TRX12184.1 TolC family protein [Flavobacterium gawalongense]TRX25148.1 TolC family protein [Flavobacterium gawalongense]